MPQPIFDKLLALGVKLPKASDSLSVHAPQDGALLAHLSVDDVSSIDRKIKAGTFAQRQLALWPRSRRGQLVEAYAQALKNHREFLGEIISADAGKTPKEALGEVDSSIDILLKTIQQSTLPELNGMLRIKERAPVGAVGLITSFNFPMVVAHWNIGPALLAGNAVVWKPSEKTPLVALACKALFDSVAGEIQDVFSVLIGGRDVGEALVAHAQIDMVSATGSVNMGEAIGRVLKTKPHSVPPILELGGNNAVVIGEHMSEAHLRWSLQAILQSFLGTTGQRCTNTRRLIVHQSWLEKTVSELERMIGELLPALQISDNAYGYNVLIDEDAYQRVEAAKKQAKTEGGKILLGERNQPALVLMPTQTSIMHVETFAPILFITAYEGDIENAMALVNAPDNAGLVNAIYTLSQKEADAFAQLNQAGHSLINSPKGTGTPAYGMGFGGNKASGAGEIVNASDPLLPFTRPEKIKRIAQNKDIPLAE